jgi:hypothetical protein
MLTLLLAMIAIEFVLMTVFLWLELKKKFLLLYPRVYRNPDIGLIGWKSFSSFYDATGPCMRNIRVTSVEGQPFTATVYLEIGKRMLDPYLIIESDRQGVAIFSTWVGTQPATLGIEASPSTKLVVTSDRDDQLLTPDAIAKPHLFQRGPAFAFAVWFGKNILRL